MLGGTTVITTVLGAVPDPRSDAKVLKSFARAATAAGLALLLVEPGSKVPADMRSPVKRRTDDTAAQQAAREAGRPNWARVKAPAGMHLASTDAKVVTNYIDRYRKTWPDQPANFAVSVGASRLIVVDCDTAEQVAAFRAWAGVPETLTPTVSTPGQRDAAGNWLHSQGGHFYFTLPEGVELPDGPGSLTMPGGFVLMWANRYVLIPPSVRAEGAYRLTGQDYPAPDGLIQVIMGHIAQRAATRNARERAAGGVDGEFQNAVDTWADSVSWSDLLSPLGWVATARPDSCGCEVWTAPGVHASPKSATAHDSGCSAGLYTESNAPLHIWTFDPGEPFESWISAHATQTVTKLQVVAMTQYGGDVGTACAELGVLVGKDDLAFDPGAAAGFGTSAPTLDPAGMTADAGVHRANLDDPAGFSVPRNHDLADEPHPDSPLGKLRAAQQRAHDKAAAAVAARTPSDAELIAIHVQRSEDEQAELDRARVPVGTVTVTPLDAQGQPTGPPVTWPAGQSDDAVFDRAAMALAGHTPPPHGAQPGTHYVVGAGGELSGPLAPLPMHTGAVPPEYVWHGPQDQAAAHDRLASGVGVPAELLRPSNHWSGNGVPEAEAQRLRDWAQQVAPQITAEARAFAAAQSGQPYTYGFADPVDVTGSLARAVADNQPAPHERMIHTPCPACAGQRGRFIGGMAGRLEVCQVCEGDSPVDLGFGPTAAESLEFAAEPSPFAVPDGVPDENTEISDDPNMPLIMPFQHWRDYPRPEFVVDGLIEAGGLCAINGAPGVGKSAVALDMAAAIAAGKRWQGRATQRHRVLYLPGEGISGAVDRLRTWESEHTHLLDDQVYMADSVVQAAAPSATWGALAEYILREKIGVLIFDTWARMSTGIEENSATDVGKVIARLDRIRKLTGCTVILIHHTAKGSNSGRGSSALNAALDSELLVTDDMWSDPDEAGSFPGKQLSLWVTKQKNAETPREAIPLLMVGRGDSIVITGPAGTTGDALDGVASPVVRTPEAIIDTAVRLRRFVDDFPEQGITRGDIVAGVRPDEFSKRRADTAKAWKLQAFRALDLALRLGMIETLTGSSTGARYIPGSTGVEEARRVAAAAAMADPGDPPAEKVTSARIDLSTASGLHVHADLIADPTHTE